MDNSKVKNQSVDSKDVSHMAYFVVTAFFLAIVEIFVASSGKNPLPVVREDAVGYLTTFIVYAFFWFLLLSVLGLFYTRILVRRTKAVHLSVTFVLFIILFIIVSFVVVSWVFQYNTGMFLSRDLVSFAVGNMEQLQLHFLQQFGGLFLGVVIGVTLLTAVLIGLITRVSHLYLSHGVLVVLVFLVFSMISVAYGFMERSKAILFYETHPILTLINTPSSRADIPSGISAVSLGLTRKYLDTERPLQDGRKHPVVVLMLESLRRDLVEMEPTPMPFLKSILSESLFFDKAYAAASHSNYGDLSVWYSQYPLRKEGFNNYDPNAPWKGTSTFQVFHDAGYQTAYISSQNEKWGGMINWLQVPEVNYFFHSEDYDGKTWVNEDDAPGLVDMIRKKIATAGKIEDSETLRIAQEWIDGLSKKGKFFLGMNLQNTHFSYVIPEGGAEPFQPSVIDFPTVYYSWPRERVDDVRNRYLNALYNMDAAISRFADFLKARGIWDNCYFVVVGDSGEAFYEHGFGNHSGPMYDEVMRTFTLIKPPKEGVIGIVEEPISHIDIMPILLDLMDIPQPGSFQGLPLKSDGEKRTIFMHSNAIVEQDGIIQWPWKRLVTHRPSHKIELYNLEDDPGETENLLGKSGVEGIARRLGSAADTWRKLQLWYYSNPSIYLEYHPPQLN